MFRIIYKFILFSLIGTLFYFFYSNSSLLLYGWKQAKGQIQIIINTKSTEKILADPHFPDSLKQKIKLVEEIKTFAFDSIGINASTNYTSIYNQNGKPLMWVVTASKSFEIVPYEWVFPVLGSLSYKGFFDYKEAEKEAAKLYAMGYDTDIGTASAWSTLGLFKDPILSDMLLKKEGALANLIIHEFTHSCVYISDSVSYNENLANFIGHKGALKFLKNKYGLNSKEYITYIQYRKDSELFSNYTLLYTQKLQAAYASFNRDTSVQQKFKTKMKLINQYVSGMDTLPLKNKTLYKRIAKDALQSKNAFFISFIQYESKADIFENEFKNHFNSDLKKYMVFLKEKYPGNYFGF